MNKSTSLCASAIGLAAIAGGALAAPIRIDFDTDANGGAIAGGTVVNALYATLCVTFAHEAPPAAAPVRTSMPAPTSRRASDRRPTS